MIECVYYNDFIRCYRNGVVERFYYRKYWRIVENTPNQSKGYNCIGTDCKKTIQRHRLIAFCFKGLKNIKGERKGDDIDHIDGNRLNNSVDNLRIVTNSQNHFNRKNTKGYCRHKNKWQAAIKINQKNINLGRFENENDAKEAYLNAKRLYHII